MNPKSSTVPEPHVVPTRKPLWQRNSSQGAPLPRIQAVLEPHFSTGKQGQEEGPQKEQGVKDQQQGLHGQGEEDVCGGENVEEHEHQQLWGKQERQGGGAGENQQQHEWHGRQQHQEFGDGDCADEWSAGRTDEWSARPSGQQQWSAGQGGQEERKDQHQEEEKHLQPRSFGKVASAGRGGPRDGAATATVQRRPAAATSQGKWSHALELCHSPMVMPPSFLLCLIIDLVSPAGCIHVCVHCLDLQSKCLMLVCQFLLG